MVLEGKDWPNQPKYLEEAFYLLVNAHSQTSQDNLRWILDDPYVATWLSISDNKQINSATIMTESH